MKIALFTDTYLPQINGVATHVKTLKEGMERIGHQVLVVTADPSVSAHCIDDGILRCPAAGIKELYGYGMAPSHSAEREHILADFSFDVIHVHTEFGIGLSGAAIARRRKIPLVYTLHTMWEQYLHYVVPRTVYPIAREAARTYIGYFAGKADEIISPSSKVQGFLKDCGIWQELNVVPNAVELDRFSRHLVPPQVVDRLREDLGLTPADLVLCFCGRLGEEKSVDVLVNFFAQLHHPGDHIRLLIIGAGPTHKALEQQARSLGLVDSVIFAGAVPHERMPDFLACCDLYVTASLSEVNSISMLEAMAMELPVLHRVDEKNPGQVTEGVNGFLFRTAEEFCRAVNRFRNGSAEDRLRLRASTVESVRSAGQEGLARRVEAVYLKQWEKSGNLRLENTRKNYMSHPKLD